ncbi:MAG: Ig-like domain-containing protein, partial [Candidatus Anstonellales archaeon]
ITVQSINPEYSDSGKILIKKCEPCDISNPCRIAKCSVETGYKCVYEEIDNQSTAQCSGLLENCTKKICLKGTCQIIKDEQCTIKENYNLSFVSPFYELINEFKLNKNKDIVEINPTELNYVCKLSANEYEVAPNEEVKIRFQHLEIEDGQNINIQCTTGVVKNCQVKNNVCEITCIFPVEGTYVVNTVPGRSECTPIVVRVTSLAKKNCVLLASQKEGKGQTTVNITVLFYREDSPNFEFSCDGKEFRKINSLSNVYRTSCTYNPTSDMIYAKPTAKTSSYNCSSELEIEPLLDLIPPSIFVESPIDNARYSNFVNVSAYATDNVKVAKLELFIDGKLHKTIEGNKIDYMFFVYPFPENSRHQLFLRAYDKSGNTKSSKIYTFYRDFNYGTCMITANSNYKLAPSEFLLNISFDKIPTNVSRIKIFENYESNSSIYKEYDIPKNRQMSYLVTYSNAKSYIFRVEDVNNTFFCEKKLTLLAKRDNEPPKLEELTIDNIMDIRYDNLFYAKFNDETEIKDIRAYINNKLLCTLDSNNLIEQLTNSSSENTKEISCKLNTRDLGIGTHTLRILASDVFNNQGTYERTFNIESPFKCRFMPTEITLTNNNSATVEFECYTQYGKTTCPTSTTFLKSNEYILGSLSQKSPENETNASTSLIYNYKITIPQFVNEGIYTITAYDKNSEMECTIKVNVIDNSKFRCEIIPKTNQIINNQNLEVVVNYYNYSTPGYLILVCKSGDSKICFTEKINGNCTFTCNYFDPGNYTLSAITTYQRCFYSNITVTLIDTV